MHHSVSYPWRLPDLITGRDSRLRLLRLEALMYRVVIYKLPIPFANGYCVTNGTVTSRPASLFGVTGKRNTKSMLMNGVRKSEATSISISMGRKVSELRML
jgi:hypothetical protein